MDGAATATLNRVDEGSVVSLSTATVATLPRVSGCPAEKAPTQRGRHKSLPSIPAVRQAKHLISSHPSR